jgi:four helix bundle protein
MPSKFEDLVVFKRAVALLQDVYTATAAFPRSELYGLSSQMRRASVSLLSQIAEGQGRLTYGEWRQFLSQARGSLFELEAQLIAAAHLEFLTAEQCSALRERSRSVGRALAGLIRFVRKREEQSKHDRSPATGHRSPAT